MAFLCLMAGRMQAQNPIIRNQFSADPTARVFDGKIYLYPSHDIPSPIERLKEWFCMADYHVFSSDDLTHWEDHGVIVSQERIPWAKPDAYSMWAPIVSARMASIISISLLLPGAWKRDLLWEWLYRTSHAALLCRRCVP